MSKQRVVVFVFVLVIFAISASGCSVVDWVLGKYSPLHGAWKFKDNALGPQVFTIHKDSSYEIDEDGDGVKDVWGHYNISYNSITFREKNLNSIRECQLGGVYQYKIKGGELSLTLVGDECVARVDATSHPWIRVRR